jgi:hypothetical protein
VWLVPQQESAGGSHGRGSTPVALLRADRLDGATEYRLTAERTGGASVSSQPFRPGASEVVDWDLAANVHPAAAAATPTP